MTVHPDTLELIRLALREDLGSGDVTTEACVPADLMANGRYMARQPMIVAGTELLEFIFAERGGADELRILRPTGTRAEDGDTIATVRGRARTLLECERVSLNFLQRLSGIATNAHKYAAAVAGTKCRVLDTRKTTPGLRRLEKLASAAGGVVNHRMGLYDAVLIKNNHITAAGGVRQALSRPYPPGVRVQVEVRTRPDIDEALAAGAQHLLLDNLTPKQAAEEIRRIAGRASVELSGNIDLNSIRAYAETGADFVSSGAITHSAVSANLNFRLELLPVSKVGQDVLLGAGLPTAAQPDRTMIHWHDTVPSTMELAAALAAKGCEPFTTVVADEQTAGQGRFGRTWHSEKGSGLYASIVLRLSEPPPVVTLALGLAAREAIYRTAAVVADLRWPNDLLLDNRKVGGILAQVQHGAVIAGIGINVNQTAFPPELQPVATSLRIVTGREHDAHDLLAQLIAGVRRFVSLTPADIREQFAAASTWVRGKHVRIEGSSPISGITAGLNEDGFLLVRDDTGRLHTVVAGGVRAARA
ncbi:MAG TPA: carboxylating nicotinate-nucleotide diphosphorylase [Bryobacteraceae bacterium]|nr:carboxylating nicotinate-nucleotide diphosphorylase [Bryobacteraceae bacterium]